MHLQYKSEIFPSFVKKHDKNQSVAYYKQICDNKCLLCIAGIFFIFFLNKLLALLASMHMGLCCVSTNVFLFSPRGYKDHLRNIEEKVGKYVKKGEYILPPLFTRV